MWRTISITWLRPPWKRNGGCHSQGRLLFANLIMVLVLVFGLGLDAVIGAILGHVYVSVLVVVAVAVFCRSLLPLVVVF